MTPTTANLRTQNPFALSTTTTDAVMARPHMLVTDPLGNRRGEREPEAPEQAPAHTVSQPPSSGVSSQPRGVGTSPPLREQIVAEATRLLSLLIEFGELERQLKRGGES